MSNEFVVKKGLIVNGDTTVSSLASLSGNFLTTDVTGKLVDSGINTSTINALSGQVLSNDFDISVLRTDVNTISGDLDILETYTNGITGGITQLDDRYVNVTGDTMTGELVVQTGNEQPNQLGLQLNLKNLYGADNETTGMGLYDTDGWAWTVASQRVDTNNGHLEIYEERINGGLPIVRFKMADHSTEFRGDVNILDADLTITNLASISGNLLTTDVTGKLVDSGINTSTINALSGSYVNLAGDTMTGQLNMGASIVPTVSGGYDLGSASLPWRDLYVTGNSINMGGVALGIVNGNLAVDGNEVVTISGMSAGQFSIDEVDGSTGYFVNKILPGSNITFTEQVSGGNKTLYINSNLDAQLWSNGIYGSQEIPVNDDTVRISYGLSISGSGFPIVSLVMPTSGDFLQVTGIYNSNTTGFDVMLSSPVRAEGYKINWTLNTSAQFDLSSLDQSIIPSQDITYDLGSPTNRWRDLYLSGNTMYIGDQTLSVVDAISGTTSQISFGGQEIALFNQDGSLPLSAIPAEIQSGLTFIDMLDPTTTSLPNISGYGIGNFFISSNTGTFTDGISASFSVAEGDWAINNGTTWKKMPFKLPVRGITSAQIKVGAIQNDNIFSGAVTESKIGSGAVTLSKIGTNVLKVSNLTTTELDVSKVIRPDGQGNLTWGTVNLNVDDLEARTTSAEQEASLASTNVQTVSAGFANLESNFNIVYSQVQSISSQVDTIQTTLDQQNTTKDIASATYTILLTDNGKTLFFTYAGAITISLPNNIGDTVHVTCVLVDASGSLAFTATGGSTLSSKESKVSVTDQYGVATAVHRGSDAWYLFGNLV